MDVVVFLNQDDSVTAGSRSIRRGCLDLRGDDDVRTIGRPHPRQAGERLMRQRPKISVDTDNDG